MKIKKIKSDAYSSEQVKEIVFIYEQLSNDINALRLKVFELEKQVGPKSIFNIFKGDDKVKIELKELKTKLQTLINVRNDSVKEAKLHKSVLKGIKCDFIRFQLVP